MYEPEAWTALAIILGLTSDTLAGPRYSSMALPGCVLPAWRVPMMAILAGKLEARRADCAPVAGKSTLNRLELSRSIATRYHEISHDPAAIETLFVDLFLEAHSKAPAQIILDLDATDDPLHGQQEGRFFHGYRPTRARAKHWKWPI
jgi:hypothetical protein